MVDPSHTFHIADYIVFGITIVISIGIGVYYAFAGDGQRTTSDFLVGGRTMAYLPVAISLIATFESSIMMLGLPAEAYVYGIQWWIGCFGFLVSQLLSVLIIVPLLHPLKITSAYEYLQLRFDSTAVRLLGSSLGMLTTIFYMGIVLFGPAVALEAVTGFSQWGSIFVIAIVTIIYTAIGGLKAVIWTDVFQSAIMYSGMLAVLIKGTIDVGSPSKVWKIAEAGGRMNLFNFDLDPRTRHTFWNLFFGSAIRGFGLSFNQATVQRISATRTKADARKVLLFSAPVYFVSLTLAFYEGIVAFSYYDVIGCDPLKSKKIVNPNQLIPFTVMDIFQSLPGMPGLFMASLFSASLSTLSSGLSSLAAMTWADFVKPRIGMISELKATIIAKVSVVIFGFLGCGVALLVSLIGGPLNQISGSLLSASGGPLTGLFLLGCFCPNANSKGALIGGGLSLILSCWLSLGQTFSKNVQQEPWLPPASTANCWAKHNFSDVLTTPSYYDVMASPYDVSGPSAAVNDVWESTTSKDVLKNFQPQGVDTMYMMSYTLLAPVGIICTLVLGIVVSFLTGGNKDKPVDPRYLISIADHCLCLLPESVKRIIRCGAVNTAVKSDTNLPLHDIFLDKEILVEVEKDSSLPMMVATDLDSVQPRSDVGSGVPAERNREGDKVSGSYVKYSVSGEDGDVTIPANRLSKEDGVTTVKEEKEKAPVPDNSSDN